jgi:hypothetical protein
MTLDEADKIIAELTICWPSRKLIVEEVHRWESNLSAYDYELSRSAVKMLEKTSKFFPSWADFYEVIQPMALRQRNESAMLALESGEEPCTPEQNLTEIAKIRKILDKMGARFSE